MTVNEQICQRVR